MSGCWGRACLVCVDQHVEVVPFLNFDAENVVYAELLEPLYGVWGGEAGKQHVVLDEGLEDVLWDGTLLLPLHYERGKVFVHEGATSLLESIV